MVAGAGIGGPTMAALAVAFSDAPYLHAFREPFIGISGVGAFSEVRMRHLV